MEQKSLREPYWTSTWTLGVVSLVLSVKGNRCTSWIERCAGWGSVGMASLVPAARIALSQVAPTRVSVRGWWMPWLCVWGVVVMVWKWRCKKVSCDVRRLQRWVRKVGVVYFITDFTFVTGRSTSRAVAQSSLVNPKFYQTNRSSDEMESFWGVLSLKWNILWHDSSYTFSLTVSCSNSLTHVYVLNRLLLSLEESASAIVSRKAKW